VVHPGEAHFTYEDRTVVDLEAEPDEGTSLSSGAAMWIPLPMSKLPLQLSQ
jgi:hypothetical protein